MYQENTVINFTDMGLRHIRQSIALQSEATGFRLGVKKTGCSGYAYVTEIVTDGKAEDIKFNIEDITVFIEKNSVPYLQGTMIDFIDHGMGQTKLVFHNPNAANLCGCGESFNLLEE